MKTLKDCFGRKVPLTDERLAHILEHPEMKGTAYLTDKPKPGEDLWPIK
jgi:hypothetical protein